jgi:hypothetical protein
MNTIFKLKNQNMKKILMLAVVCSLATGAFAADKRSKKAKKAKQCTTQQCCKPADCKPSECKPANCTMMPNCKKA